MLEFTAACIVLWCTVTYWLGGQELPIFDRGYKWIRRFVLPAGLLVGLCLLASMQGTLLITFPYAAFACAALTGVFHLGYRNHLWKYALTGALMGAPSLLLGVHWTCVLPLACHVGLGYASLKDNRFMWCMVALALGMSIGIAYVVPVLK